MRYHLIPLGLAFLLTACEQDPTGPVPGPQVDVGREFPKPDQGEDTIFCLKKRPPVSALKNGAEALRDHPECNVL